jgi:hypothetical protein
MITLRRKPERRISHGKALDDHVLVGRLRSYPAGEKTTPIEKQRERREDDRRSARFHVSGSTRSPVDLSMLDYRWGSLTDTGITLILRPLFCCDWGMKRLFPVICVCSCLIAAHSFAGSATWSTNPISGDWNTAANWTPPTVPNGPTDVATFATSSKTALSIGSSVEVSEIVYNQGASAFTTSSSFGLTISGPGITNNSGIVQNFVVGIGPLFFSNSATAGSQTAFTVADTVPSGEGQVDFTDTASAGNATFVATGGNFVGQPGGIVFFLDSSTASNAVITNKGRLLDTAAGGGETKFIGSATAGNATITNEPNGTALSGPSGVLTFDETCSAASSVITNEGAAISGQIGGNTNFYDQSTADKATIICNGGQVTGAGGGIVQFTNAATPSKATLIANGGTNGGDGGKIKLLSHPRQSGPRVQIYGNGTLEMGDGGITLGSLEGSGIVTTGVTVGNNNSNTTFSGTILGALLVKVGTGTLTLSGTNSASATVSGGTLIVTGTIGSTFFSTTVSNGTLGGSGVITTELFVGDSSGKPAFLAPAAGQNRQSTLTVQQDVFMTGAATYTYTFRAKGRRVRSDLLVAKGVTLNSGGSATIDIQGSVQGTLATGLTLTLISNTSANPMTGRFSNLADGAIVTIGGNTFQANYEGGDGNDLTLTVVP